MDENPSTITRLHVPVKPRCCPQTKPNRRSQAGLCAAVYVFFRFTGEGARGWRAPANLPCCAEGGWEGGLNVWLCSMNEESQGEQDAEYEMEPRGTGEALVKRGAGARVEGPHLADRYRQR